MFVFGVAVSDPAQYRRCAQVGIDEVAQPADVVIARRGTSLQRAYNEILDTSGRRDDLEAVVLVHQDLRIACPDLVQRIRTLLADRSVGLVGSSGGIGADGLAWWDGAQTIGGFGSEIDGRIYPVGERAQAVHEVDAVDGMLLVLSAWAARRVRFDLRFEQDFHGYDTDIAWQVRALGGRVLVADLWCIHERLGKIGERRGAWVRASLAFDRKWSGCSPRRAPWMPGRRLPSMREQISSEAIRFQPDRQSAGATG